MKTLEQFKNENETWLGMVISDYANEMSFEPGMNNHSGDYFTDTRYVVSEKFEELDIDNDELLNEVQYYIEGEVVKILGGK